MTSADPVFQTDLPLPLLTRGKVRDVYDLGDRLLIVATDRLSAFDVVMPTPIPHKGTVLTLLSHYWFHLTSEICANHLLEGRDDELPDDLSNPVGLRSRAAVVRKTTPFPVECVARGYLSGSAWAEYRKSAPRDGIVELWGVRLPAGLRESEKLPEPIFTPSTKATDGHDESIPFDRMVDLIGKEAANTLRDRTLAVYSAGCRFAESRDLIIADTKFEFGERDGTILLIDELLTPDSSRFWDVRTYEPGHPQPSFDKQYVRDWLQGLVNAGQWDKTPPGPELPNEIVRGTSERYMEAYLRITGQTFPGH